MKAIQQRNAQMIRRQALDKLLVFDLNTSLPMGQVLDMSTRGLKLQSEEPTTFRQVYYCRILLKNRICGRDEVLFDAECRWCNRDEETGCYYSGYVLRFPTKKDAEVIRELTHRWMAGHSEQLNSRYGGSKKERRSLLSRIFKPAEV
jgi:hypothetical protein